ncbi:zinc finger, CW-type containing protein [Tanacetum coccineum]
MMMVQSPVNAGLSSVPDHAKHETSSCVWIPGDVSWQLPIHQKNTDSSLCSGNLISSSQLSAAVNTSESSTPNVVYKRRTIHKTVLPPNPNTSENPTPKVVYKRTTHKKVSQPNPNSAATIVYKRKKVQTESKSGSVDRDELIEDPKSKIQKCQNLRAVNDSCSSSKSNVDLGSGFLKQQVDDVGECSSSGIVISETNSCFEFLKQHGVLERIISTRSKKTACYEKNLSCLKSCKVCDRMKTTLKMVICDLCEESFHMSCCSPPVKKVPVGDWFCHSCSKKKLEKSKGASSRKLSEDYVGPITSMLRDAKPYTSNVRVGEDFQVEVQDWSGPLTEYVFLGPL